MALFVFGPHKSAQQHSVTTSYNLAKLHWAEPRPGSACTITDGAGNLVATLTDKVRDIPFNPPKAVTGLKILGVNSGFLHVYTQDPSSFGG